jgi:hypothetical protein
MKSLSAIPFALVFTMLLSLVMVLIWSIPLYFLWNWLAPIFIYQLPPVYLNASFFQVAGIMIFFQALHLALTPTKIDFTSK